MSIENTADRDPIIHLLGAMSDGTGHYIEDLEARGQQQLVNSDRLPTRTQDGDEPYLTAGFAFGPADPSDPLFRPASLPHGWKRERSDHSMWSYLVDEHSRRRVAIFYKAAFYDRDAFMRMESPRSYLRNAVYGGTEPLLDDTWLTRDVAVAELEELRESWLEDAADSKRYARRGDDSYWVKRAKEVRGLAAKADKLRNRIAGGAR
jgi:hypothetical protein